MAIVVFILIAGLWAAFLLPSFFDQRRQAPSSTTRDFARTRQLLASVSASHPDGAQYVRMHSQRRRARILAGLGITAAVTLGVATWTGSVPWLWATIVVDLVIAGYVTILLAVKRQQFAPRAAVVPIGSAAPAPIAVPDVPEIPETATVRVIAG